MSRISNTEDALIEQTDVAPLREMGWGIVNAYHKFDYCTCNLGHTKKNFDFGERLEELNEALGDLNAEARELEERIVQNVGGLLQSNDAVTNDEPDSD